MKIAICASLKSFQKVLSIGKKLEEKGVEVLYPWTIILVQKGKLHPKKIPQFKLNNKSRAIKIHYEKIKKSDAILVVNETKHQIKNYIGGNTLMEMGFAYILNKKIYLLNPIPKMQYSEEIKAMKPIVLEGNINKITG